MTTFQVLIQIGDAAGQRFEEVEAVVDTGSTFTAAPRALLERLGIRPTRRHRFRIASGDVAENDVGEAVIRVAGGQGTTPVIFAEPGEPVLLGAFTLEQLLLGVDPVAQGLIPVEGLRVSRFPLAERESLRGERP
jgi:aspartyl protease family protein